MIYLDNCSTTEMREEVIEKMVEAMKNDFANPSALHSIGFQTEKKIEEARKIIGDYLRVDKDEIYFTSGGTESNNLAISAAVKKLRNRGRHIITSEIEHASVLNKMKNLEDEGFEVSYLPVDKDGNISLDKLKDVLRQDTILVSLMHINNEIGNILDIDKVKELMEEKNDFSLLHVDGVQSFGKIEFYLRDLNVDLYSFSSHKVHGPKGIGGLYISKKNYLAPVVYGGNQERGFRSGTENVPAIIGFGEAVRILAKNGLEERKLVKGLKEYFKERLLEEINDVKINGNLNNSSPYILNISINNTRGEVLLHYLEQENIFISTSSACSSNDTEKSHVLKSIGLSDEEIEGSIRICFSYKISKEDIDKTIEVMKKSVEEIRDVMMR